jgi:hypothetical protein
MRSILSLILFFILSGIAFAHGDDHLMGKSEGSLQSTYSEEVSSPYSTESVMSETNANNMYVVSEEDNNAQEHMDHSLGRTIFNSIEPEIVPMEKMQKMDHEEGSNSKNIMKEITPSEHEIVSTSQKGYGSAAGFTLAAGLAFGVMMIRRSN